MLQKRSLRVESLECRRVLAADCELAGAVMPFGMSDCIATMTNESADMIRPEIASTQSASFPVIGYPHFPYSSDLIQEHGQRLFVIDQDPNSIESNKLFVFDRAEDGSLTESVAVDVAFPVGQMFVLGERVILIENSFRWGIPAANFDSVVSTDSNGEVRTLPPFGNQRVDVMTINLDGEMSVVTQELDGQFHSAVLEGDTLVVTGNNGFDFVVAIYPPPAIENVVTTYRITSAGLQKIASATLPQIGVTQVNGTSFYSAFTVRPDIVLLPPGNSTEDSTSSTGTVETIREPNDRPYFPTAILARYQLGEDGIHEVVKTELGNGYISTLSVAEDGVTGFALRSELLGVGPSMVIDLLNFANGGVSVFESVRLENFQGDIFEQTPEYVVLKSYSDNSLVVVNLSQSTDLSAVNRVRRIDVPQNLHLRFESLLVNNDRFVVRAERVELTNALPSPGANGRLLADRTNPPAPVETVLLTVAISDARVIAETVLLEPVAPYLPLRLFSIDRSTSRFGYISWNADFSGYSEQLTFGRLNDAGSFIVDGEISGGRWLETDANADRLIARTSDELLEYSWTSDDEPVVTPLGEPEPPISAVDDVFTLVSAEHDQYVDVLANDVLNTHFFHDLPLIVELTNAPNGAQIVDGRLIRIPSDALRDRETLRFEYTISDGVDRSTANVEIVIRSSFEDRVRELVQAVRVEAAEDFNVRLEEVVVVSVERRADGRPLLGDSTDPTFGLFVTVSVPSATARYGVMLDGTITQLTVTRLEKLLEIGLRAVNDDGETLERIVQGQSFWLELNARDLRPGGRGVFAAFFDLVVPTEILEVTGTVEHSPGYSGIKTGSTSKGEVDDLGAVATGVNFPGSDVQSLLRIGVRAVGTGRVTLQPESADGTGTASLLHGLSSEVSADQVRYQPLVLSITETAVIDPLDVDGSGSVTARDALAVINFLNRFGNVELASLAASVRSGNAEGEDPIEVELTQMRRLDTSADGVITALDALNIINRLHRQSFALFSNDREEESEESIELLVGMPIDDDGDDEKI